MRSSILDHRMVRVSSVFHPWQMRIGMAEKKRLLDVWIVELKTVYREVPFAVVTDWLQQGRLLADDRVRLTGTADWRIVGKIPTLAAFLPKPEPGRADDQAEALEQVATGFGMQRRGQ